MRRSFSAPRQAQLVGLDILILHEYLSKDLMKKELMKKRQEQEHLLLQTASSDLHHSNYKKCYSSLRSFATERTSMSAVTQLYIYYYFTYSTYKIINKFLIKNKTNVTSISIFLDLYALALYKWHIFLTEIIENKENIQFLQELTGLLLINKTYQMNKFLSKQQNPEYRSKRRELIRQIDLFQTQFSILKKTPKNRSQSVELITPQQFNSFMSKQTSKFLWAFMKFQQLSLLAKYRIQQLLNKPNYKVISIYYNELKRVNDHLGSTKQMITLRHLSEALIIQSSFLWIVANDLEQVSKVLKQSFDASIKGIEVIIELAQGQILSEISTSKIIQFYCCLRLTLISLKLINLVSGERNDFQGILSTQKLIHWIEWNVTKFIANEFSMIRLTNQLLSLQDHCNRSSNQVYEKFQRYIEKSAEIRRFVLKLWGDVPIRQDNFNSLLDEFNNLMYTKFKNQDLNEQMMYIKVRPQSAICMMQKIQEKIQRPITPVSQLNTSVSFQRPKDFLKDKNEEENQEVEKGAAQLYVEEIYSKFSKNKSKFQKLTNYERNLLQKKFKFMDTRLQKLIALEHQKQIRQEKINKYSKFKEYLDEDLRLEMLEHMNEYFERLVEKSLEEKEKLRSYEEIYEDFLVKMKTTQLDQRGILEDKMLINFFRKFGRGIFQLEYDDILSKQEEKNRIQQLNMLEQNGFQVEEVAFQNRESHVFEKKKEKPVKQFKIQKQQQTMNTEIQTQQQVTRTEQSISPPSKKLQETLFRHEKKLEISTFYNMYQREVKDEQKKLGKSQSENLLKKTIQNRIFPRKIEQKQYWEKASEGLKTHMHLSLIEGKDIDKSREKAIQNLNRFYLQSSLQKQKIKEKPTWSNSDLASSTVMLSTKSSIYKKKITFADLSKYAYQLFKQE